MTNEVIFEKLNEMLERDEKLVWTEVVDNLGFKGNWMKVRGVLQFMIDEKMLKRTHDLHTEVYLKI